MYQLQIPFGEAVKRALTVNYCNLQGRASRSEYWWFVLFAFVVGAAINVLFCWSTTLNYIISGVVSLAFLLPNLGLAVRRLHDTGHSGWWIFINCVPLVGWIIYLIFVIKESEPVPNKWGQIPNLMQ